MKTLAVRTTALLIAAGLGLSTGASFAAESLQDVMKRRNLNQQDLNFGEPGAEGAELSVLSDALQMHSSSMMKLKIY